MELRAIIVQALCASGIAAQEQVVCAAGAADIVTARRDAVIEVKLDLTRKQIQWAVGQVLLYRAAINPQARAIIVGYATDETAGLVEWAAAVGVEVICWAEGLGLRAEILSLPSALSPQPFALRWNVQSLAQSHGISRVADLARFADIPRQSLYGLWRGSQVNVSVAMLERWPNGWGRRPIPGFGRRLVPLDRRAAQLGREPCGRANRAGCGAARLQCGPVSAAGRFVLVRPSQIRVR